MKTNELVKLENAMVKGHLPINLKLAREVKIETLDYIVFIESTYHQTTKLESQHFYKSISRLLQRHG